MDENEIDLERIDEQLKMEKIRQAAGKVNWEGFNHALRKNLMEKRLVFDADGRVDLLEALGAMRRSLPVFPDLDVMSKLKLLADSLECSFSAQNGVVTIRNLDVNLELILSKNEITSCTIGYYGHAPTPCHEMKDMLNNNDIGEFRTVIFNMLRRLPAKLSHPDKMEHLHVLEQVESECYRSNTGKDATFESINGSPVGFFMPTTPKKPARIFYTIEPSYIATLQRPLDASDFDVLPYIELSTSTIEKKGDKASGNCCICLQFSTPIVFCERTWRAIQPLLAKQSTIRQHVNSYRYIAGYKSIKTDTMLLRTNFAVKGCIQHEYAIPSRFLRGEADVIVGEVFVRTFNDICRLLPMIRAQAVQNSLWESVIASCSGKFASDVYVKMKMIPADNFFELCFPTSTAILAVRFESINSEWTLSISSADGSFKDNELLKTARRQLNKTRSIPLVLAYITRCVDVHLERATDGIIDLCTDDDFYRVVHKTGSAWSLYMGKSSSRKAKKRKVLSSDDEFEIDIDLDTGCQPRAFLTSFREVEAPPPPLVVPLDPAKAVQRTTRTNTDMSLDNAFFDLEAICKLNENADEDSKASTPHFPPPALLGGPFGQQRMSSSSSASPVPNRPSNLPNPLMSPLESARMQMAKSVGAAMSMTPSSAGISPDVFDFDERSNSSYTPTNQFNFYPTHDQSPMQFGRGGAPAQKTRRPRARKAGNMGDRTPNDQQMPMVDAMGNPVFPAAVSRRGSRGKPSTRRPRGSRKSSGLPGHGDVDEQRPALQRSYSELSGNNYYSPKASSPYVDDDSDDECDPPPPPKTLPMAPMVNPPDAMLATGAGSAMHQSQPLPALHTSSTPGASSLDSPRISSPATQSSPSVFAASQPPAPSPMQNRIQPIRKNSFEAAMMAKVSSAPPPPKSTFNDLYDDGAESPPPPEERLPPAVANASDNIGVPPNSAFSTSLPSSSKPKDRDQMNESPFTVGSHQSVKNENKLILKIPKAPSARSSPSVDAQQKSKIAPLSLSKLEKAEKRKREDKKEPKDKERNREEAKEKRKRKAESSAGKEKDKEHKRHKSSSSLTDANKTPTTTTSAPRFADFRSTLGSFRIPKKETNEEKGSPREKEPPISTPSTSATTPTSTPVPAASTPFHAISAQPSTSSSSTGSTVAPPPPMPPQPTPPPIAIPRSILKNKAAAAAASGQPIVGTPPPIGAYSGGRPPLIGNVPRKPPMGPSPDRRPSMSGLPPFGGRPPLLGSAPTMPPMTMPTHSIPLPKGPPPPPPRQPDQKSTSMSSTGSSHWVPLKPQPPAIPSTPRSPSPDPNAMQIDDDLNSPDDMLRIDADE